MGINITSLLTDEDLLLCKRISELYSRVENSVPVVSQFLNLRERFIIENRLSHIFSNDESEPITFFFGGYPSAERTLLCCLPSYFRYGLTDESEYGKELSEHITALRIKSGGYVKLAHRDYLGAIIGLGIDRSAVGDILTDDEGAIVFASPSVAELMKNELIYIGRDKVKVSAVTLPDGFDYTRNFDKITSTVPSPRLDAVLSELAKTSRENAKGLITAGLVEHNYFTATKPDAAVENGDIISVRKAANTKGGKFIVDSLDEKSSKGRIRLIARKYV